MGLAFVLVTVLVPLMPFWLPVLLLGVAPGLAGVVTFAEPDPMPPSHLGFWLGATVVGFFFVASTFPPTPCCAFAADRRSRPLS
jgi:hypothetical protein